MALARRIKSDQTYSQLIPGMVSAFFGRHGVGVRYRPGVASALTPPGAVSTDAQKRLAWLYKQVVPTLEWLEEWYDRTELIELLFGGRSPDSLVMKGGSDDPVLASYDEWTVDSEVRRRMLQRHTDGE